STPGRTDQQDAAPQGATQGKGTAAGPPYAAQRGSSSAAGRAEQAYASDGSRSFQHKLMLFQVRQEGGQHYRAGTWIAPDGQSITLRPEQIHLEERHLTRQHDGRMVP